MTVPDREPSPSAAAWAQELPSDEAVRDVFKRNRPSPSAAEVLAEEARSVGLVPSVVDELVAAQTAALAEYGLLADASLSPVEVVGRRDEEPPPFGSVPFGTMFIPGPVWLHGDNEWIECPGPLESPPRPTLSEGERELVEHVRDYGADICQAADLVDLIDRLTQPLSPPPEEQEP